MPLGDGGHPDGDRAPSGALAPAAPVSLLDQHAAGPELPLDLHVAAARPLDGRRPLAAAAAVAAELGAASAEPL